MSAGTPEWAPPSTLVSGLDPVAAVVAAGVGYGHAPIELPDDQPLPSLQLRRVVTAPGCRLELTDHLGSRSTDAGTLTLERTPLDRPAAAPRRRAAPAPADLLVLRAGDDDGPDVATVLDGAEVAGAGPDGGTTVVLPVHGPGLDDRRAVVELARRHRAVQLPAGLPGDRVLAAALVLQLAAAGCPVIAPAAAVDDLDTLHPDLRGRIAATSAALLDDDLELARATADQKRAAWQHHDLELGWDPEAHGAPRLRPHPLPAVAVVLATRRPALLPAALAMLGDQRGVEVEVVVALHGVGGLTDVRRALIEAGLAGRVIEAPASMPFGAVVNAAVAISESPLVHKWDDDDLYGPDHLLDVVLAQRQTRAALTGKAPEFVYLQAGDETVWRLPGGAESPSPGLAGGTLLTPRAVLDELGGYPPVARAIDHHLKTRIAAAGGEVFRTHGFGFVLRRHGLGHTWQVDDERYRRRAVRSFPGLAPESGIGAAVAHAVLPADGG